MHIYGSQCISDVSKAAIEVHTNSLTLLVTLMLAGHIEKFSAETSLLVPFHVAISCVL